MAYIASSVGISSSLFLDMHRNSFHEQIKKTPSKEIKLIFSAAEFSEIKWESKYREFEFNEKWYDVSKIEKTTDGFIIHCVNDSIEATFVAMIDHWKKSNSPTGKTKILFQPTLTCGIIQLAPQNPFDNERTAFLSVQLIHSFALPVHSPPPEL